MSKIRTKLLLRFLLTSLVPIILIGTVSYSICSKTIQNKLIEAKKSSLFLVGDSIDHKLDTIDRYMDLILNNKDIQEEIYKNSASLRLNNNSSIDHVLSFIFRRDDLIDCAVLTTDSGTMYCYGGLLDRKIDYSALSWYENIVYSDKWKWHGSVDSVNIAGRYDKSFPVGSGIINKFVSDYPYYKHMGAVLLFLRQDIFDAELNSIVNESGRETAVVLDPQGNRVSGLGPYTETDFPYASAGEKSANGEVFYNHVEGNDMISVYITPKSGFTVISVMPKNEYLRELNRITVIVVVLAGVFVLYSMSMSAVFSKSYTEPILAVCVAMESLGQNDMNVGIELRTHDEMDKVILGFNKMVDQIRGLFEQVVKRDKEKRRAMQTALRYQINPHFLYNSLSTIRFKAIENDDLQTAEMLSALSRYLRKTISKDEFLIPLGQEISVLNDYLYLQQIRYNNGLTVRFEIEDELLNRLVPTTMLQPLIENAIAHGLIDKLNAQAGDAEIIISAVLSGDDMVICVEDNGVGIDRDKLDSLFEPKVTIDDGVHLGIALPNVKEKLALAYGESFRIRLESEPLRYTRIIIEIFGDCL